MTRHLFFQLYLGNFSVSCTCKSFMSNVSEVILQSLQNVCVCDCECVCVCVGGYVCLLEVECVFS